MRYSPKIEKAIRTVALKHDGQYRKAPHIPYISHLFSVASIISQYFDDEDLIAAGLLHDILEDTDYTKEELLNDFGPKIASIVLSVTEGTKKEKAVGSWRQEKEGYLINLKNGVREASIISAADKIHNLMSSIQMGRLVTRAPEQYDWFHAEVFKIIKEKLGDHPIVKKHEKALKASRDYFKNLKS